MQFIQLFQTIFAREGVAIVLKPYAILSTGVDCGWVEYLEETMSLHQMKRAAAALHCRLTPVDRVPAENGEENSSLHNNSNTSIANHNCTRLEYNNHISYKPYVYKRDKPFTQLLEGGRLSLKEYFPRKYGLHGSSKHDQALDRFARSLAGYSLVTYVLQVRVCACH